MLLLDRQDLFLNCLAGKTVDVCIGPRTWELRITFTSTLQFEHMKDNDDTLKSLVTHIVTSEPFGSK